MRRRPRRLEGLSLLEVLLAGVVLTLAVLALAAAQASALRAGRTARLRGQAVGWAERALVEALAERPVAGPCPAGTSADLAAGLACRLEVESCSLDATGLRCGAPAAGPGYAWRARLVVTPPAGEEVVLEGIGVAEATP